MASSSPIIVLGSINTDLVIRGPRLPQPGETILGGEFYQSAGGKGANQAVAAARACTGPVTFIGAVGDDSLGREAISRFQAENMICEYLKVVDGQASGVALILVDHQGQNMISVASGANSFLTPSDVDQIPGAVFAAAKVFLTSLEIPLDTVLHGLRRARQSGLLTMLNPAPAPPNGLPEDVLQLVDVLTPNETEAALLTGWNPHEMSDGDASQVRHAALQLRSSGCRSVVVTLGARGCFVVDREIAIIPGRAVAAVDATAAGDAFNGALAAALAEGKPLIEACRWAGAAAAISVTRRGAQPTHPTRT
ncbi:MAG TPA: ribokinase, partial [Planctomycetaceae bacterium]|nr:ribokinase [Planctomycetaceae bacterium]